MEQGPAAVDVTGSVTTSVCAALLRALTTILHSHDKVLLELLEQNRALALGILGARGTSAETPAGILRGGFTSPLGPQPLTPEDLIDRPGSSVAVPGSDAWSPETFASVLGGPPGGWERPPAETPELEPEGDTE